MTPRLVALITQSFEQTTEFDKATPQLGAVRVASEERPGGVRSASEERPEASERRPGALRPRFRSNHIVFYQRVWTPVVRDSVFVVV